MLRNLLLSSLSVLLGFSTLHAQQPTTAPTSLTIYNQDFAVARSDVPLDLNPGLNEVLTTNVTSQLEPDSVVLRDPSGRNAINILEQNYDAGVVTQQWLLEKYEGKTLDFQTYTSGIIMKALDERSAPPPTLVQGRIIRAGTNPLIEVDGKMRFGFPEFRSFPPTRMTCC